MSNKDLAEVDDDMHLHHPPALATNQNKASFVRLQQSSSPLRQQIIDEANRPLLDDDLQNQLKKELPSNLER